MHIHILGIAGTFMGGIALIAKQLGYKVSGQDANIYPPMSTQLTQENINFTRGYHAKDLPQADIFIIGNVLSRGNECVEYILSNNLNYTSAPFWLGENVLKQKWVIAVSGTHGKTTTTAMIAHILEENGYNPSFLIGGICNNFTTSSRLTDSLFFVIEADEYDTAFFDKRSKFIHYYPNTLVINNLEFDHADIFSSINDILKEFHRLIRTLPTEAQIIYPAKETIIKQLLAMGCWSKAKSFTKNSYKTHQNITTFTLKQQEITLRTQGEHNVNNATAAIYACLHAGIPIAHSAKALTKFDGVKRRMEVRFKNENITVYDDFAHHPTSIQTTIDGLKKQLNNASSYTNKKIIVVLELRSNTMKSGYFNEELIKSLATVDEVLILKHNIIAKNITTYYSTTEILIALQGKAGNIVFMSNGSFNEIIDEFIVSL